MPVVTVIVPVYKVEPFIARCARSLFGQTLQDMEFIFVDDCTPDQSMEVLWKILEEEFPERKPQVRSYRMPRNSGLHNVRIQGIQMATGDYIIPCDSDDYVETDAYRQMYEKAVEGDYDLVTCDFYQEGQGQKKRRHCEITSIDELVATEIPWSVWGKMVSRNLLQEDIIPPAASNGEDMCFTLQIALKAKSIGHVNRPLYHYCFNGESITKLSGYTAAINRWKAIMLNANIVLPLLTEHYGYSHTHPSIIRFKYFCRQNLRPIVHSREGYRLWKNTFPEIDSVFLSTKGVSSEDKFWFVLIHLHLYGFVKGITKFFRGGRA